MAGHGMLRLTVASTKMVVRSPDIILTAVLVPVAYVGLVALLRRLSFVLPGATIDILTYMAIGVATVMIAEINQHTLVAAAATHKSTGTLKRIAVTPISPAIFIAAEAIPRVVIALVEAAAVLLFARALGVGILLGPGLALALVLVLVMVLIGLSLGFAVAGYTRTAQGANQLDTFLGTPLIMLSGALFPIAAFPDWLQRIVEYAVPYTALLEAVRAVVSGAGNPANLARQAAIGAVWLVVAFLLAVRTYRFGES